MPSRPRDRQFTSSQSKYNTSLRRSSNNTVAVPAKKREFVQTSRPACYISKKIFLPFFFFFFTLSSIGKPGPQECRKIHRIDANRCSGRIHQLTHRSESQFAFHFRAKKKEHQFCMYVTVPDFLYVTLIVQRI